MYAKINESDFLKGVIAGMPYTEIDVRVEVAMLYGKTLEELTYYDFLEVQKKWIRIFIQHTKTAGHKKQSSRLLKFLRYSLKKILLPMYQSTLPGTGASRFFMQEVAGYLAQNLLFEKYKVSSSVMYSFQTSLENFFAQKVIGDWLAECPSRGLPVNMKRVCSLVGAIHEQQSGLQVIQKKDIYKMLADYCDDRLSLSTIKNYSFLPLPDNIRQQLVVNKVVFDDKLAEKFV